MKKTLMTLVGVLTLPLGLPIVVAFCRNHHQRWAILVVNMVVFVAMCVVLGNVKAIETDVNSAALAGVAFIFMACAWLGALVWSATAVRKECV